MGESQVSFTTKLRSLTMDIRNPTKGGIISFFQFQRSVALIGFGCTNQIHSFYTSSFLIPPAPTQVMKIFFPRHLQIKEPTPFKISKIQDKGDARWYILSWEASKIRLVSFVFQNHLCKERNLQARVFALLCQDSDFGLDGKRIWACLVANKVERPSSEISFISHDHVHKLSKDVSALSPFFNWYKILTASSRVKPRFIVGFMVNKTLVHNHDSCTFSWA